MNLNEQQNQQGVLIETPYVPLCSDLIMRYFSEQPNTMYDLDRQYPFGTVDIPMSIFRYGFEECVKSACFLVTDALRADKERRKAETNGQNDLVARCVSARDNLFASAVDMLSSETIKNAQSFPDKLREYYKIRGEYALSGRMIEIPIIAFDGVVGEFSNTLELPREVTQTLTVCAMINQGFTDGVHNKRFMYKILFKQMIAMSFNQDILNLDELFEGIVILSKFFGDYNIIKEHDNQEDVFKFIDDNFPEDKLDEFEKLQTPAERRKFLNDNPFGIIGVFLGSFEGDGIIPIGGYFNPDEKTLKSFEEVKEKGLNAFKIRMEDIEFMQKQEQEIYKSVNAELEQILEA